MDVAEQDKTFGCTRCEFLQPLGGQCAGCEIKRLREQVEALERVCVAAERFLRAHGASLPELVATLVNAKFFRVAP